MSVTTRGSAALNMMFMDVCRTPCMEEQRCTETEHFSLNVKCYLQLLMRALSYLVIIVEVFGTLPLVYKILRYQEGKSYISTAKVATLFVTNTISVVYSVYWDLPFHTWGEGLLQQVLYVTIVNLMILYHWRQLYAVLFMFCYFPLIVLLVMPVLPSSIIFCLMLCNLAIVFWRRGYGVFRLYRDSGLSRGLTKRNLLIANFCNVCRIYTSSVDAGDWMLTQFYIMELTFTTIYTLQYIIFSNKRRIAKLKRSPCTSG